MHAHSLQMGELLSRDCCLLPSPFANFLQSLLWERKCSHSRRAKGCVEHLVYRQHLLWSSMPFHLKLKVNHSVPWALVSEFHPMGQPLEQVVLSGGLVGLGWSAFQLSRLAKAAWLEHPPMEGCTAGGGDGCY